MINEEVSSKAINLEIRLAKLTAREIVKLLKKLLKEAEKIGGDLDAYLKNKGNQVKLKDMVKKGQLEEINVKDGELKELKKELNKHGVKFSVMKDKETGTHSVFFQAKDTKVMNKAFQNVLSNIEKKEKNKESIHKNIEKFKEMAKNTISKDKVKNKQKEQSL
ncbi:TPA: PcfB family protein [Streptococcus agalactiae]